MLRRNVELTGVVTAFYCQYCAEQGLTDSQDPLRKAVCAYYKEHWRLSGQNPHRLMTMEEIDFQSILNVAYRNLRFDNLVQRWTKRLKCTEIVNLGCGLDTRFSRLFNYSGLYYDVDFPKVLREKKRILGDSDRCRHLPTKTVTSAAFWNRSLRLTTQNPLFVAEGLFCYLKYQDILNLVQRLFHLYPNAVLICDVFLYQAHHTFFDRKSRLLLRFPTIGEKLCPVILPLLKIFPERHERIFSKDEIRQYLDEIVLVETLEGENETVCHKNHIYMPEYWIGVYKRTINATGTRSDRTTDEAGRMR